MPNKDSIRDSNLDNVGLPPKPEYPANAAAAFLLQSEKEVEASKTISTLSEEGTMHNHSGTPNAETPVTQTLDASMPHTPPLGETSKEHDETSSPIDLSHSPSEGFAYIGTQFDTLPSTVRAQVPTTMTAGPFATSHTRQDNTMQHSTLLPAMNAALTNNSTSRNHPSGIGKKNTDNQSNADAKSKKRKRRDNNQG